MQTVNLEECSSVPENAIAGFGQFSPITGRRQAGEKMGRYLEAEVGSLSLNKGMMLACLNTLGTRHRRRLV